MGGIGNILPSDLIIILGGKTGRDGIGGAAFSSGSLTDTSEKEFSHAVQIGNPIEEQKLSKVILNTTHLIKAVTDCGAGGIGVAIPELVENWGGEVELMNLPTKCDGLSYRELWLSESQERMAIIVASKDIDEFSRLSAEENVEVGIVGKVTNTHRMVVRYDNHIVLDMELDFLLGNNIYGALRELSKIWQDIYNREYGNWKRKYDTLNCKQLSILQTTGIDIFNELLDDDDFVERTWGNPCNRNIYYKTVGV